MALVSFAYMWARAVVVAMPKVEGDNSGFYQAKLSTARFFMKRLLPQAESLAKTLMEMPADSI